MKGRTFKITVLLAILIIAELNIISFTCAVDTIVETNLKQNIIVCKSGKGDYNTIQEAIDNVSEGSTIFVKSGSYDEIIEIKKSINLIGEDRYNTIINPISEKNKYAIHLGAPGVKINNFSITNGAPGIYTTGIRVSSSETEIENCDIYDNPVGIAIWTSNNVINSCDFWGCKDEGIALIGTINSKCDFNKITNCKFSKNCDGIELQYSSKNIITDCEFYENTHTGIDAITSSNENNTISNCKINNNKVHGIYLSDSSNNIILDCSVSENNEGNIIMNKDSQNNEIKFSAEIEEDKIKTIQIIEEEAVQKYSGLKKEIFKKSNIKNIFDVISNLILLIKKFIVLSINNGLGNDL